MDKPANHRGKVIYAGDYQVNCNHDKHIPPIEEHAPPSVGWRAHFVLTNPACSLLLCVLMLRSTLHTVWCLKGDWLYH